MSFHNLAPHTRRGHFLEVEKTLVRDGAEYECDTFVVFFYQYVDGICDYDAKNGNHLQHEAVCLSQSWF